jgi:gamma-glutamylcyclotransferase (GGCT)/AIG2-like uncharacterized protein YtfP
MKIFCYGTLKKNVGGEIGHMHYVLKDQEFLGEAETQNGYLLYNLGWHPGMVKTTEKKSVKGEVWEVSKSCIKLLDEIEGDWFKRKKIKLKNVFEKNSVQSYLYIGPYTGEVLTEWNLP